MFQKMFLALAVLGTVVCASAKNKMAVNGGVTTARYATGSTPAISDNNMQVVPFSATDVVFDNYHLIDAGNAAFLVPVTGFYSVAARITLEPTAATGELKVFLFNSTTSTVFDQSVYVKASSSSFSPSTYASSIVFAKAGDLILSQIFHSFGTTLNLSGDATQNWFEINKLD